MSIDLVVLLTILAGTAGMSWRFRRRGARGVRLAVAASLAFYGLVLVAMMAAHSVEIAYHVVAGDTRISGDAWRYDFHTYALELLGAVLIWQGARALQAAARVADGAGRVDRSGWHAVVITLAVAAPLIPVHAFFGALMSAISLLMLVVMLTSAGALRRTTAGQG